VAGTLDVPTTPGRASVAELRASVRGEVLTAGDPRYDAARTVWNAAVDRHPALVVRCAGTADVLAAVGFARSEGMELVVRAGGHSLAGHSTCDGGLVVDLSPMKGIRVDAAARLAVLEPGVTWREVDHETQAHGLAVPGGLVSTTGVAGFTLGGGLGWLTRRFGLTCDSLLAADLVTADGRLLRVSEGSRPDLLWGLRGGSGGLGVVTSLELGLHPLIAPVLVSRVFYAKDDALRVLQGWRTVAAAAPDELACLVQLTVAPPVPLLPERLHGRPVVAVVAVHSGRAADAQRDVRPLRRLATPLADATEQLPYVRAQSLTDAQWTRGAHNYFTSLLLEDLPDEVLERLVSAHELAPAGRSELHLHRLGGALATVPAGATAFTHRQAAYAVNMIARSPGRDGFAAQVAWARACREQLLVHSVGSYVNWLGSGDEDRLAAAYPPAAQARLQALHDRYDPTGLFRRPTQRSTP
jgi:FAD/FMN-containing dehydrogenase